MTIMATALRTWFTRSAAWFASAYAELSEDMVRDVTGEVLARRGGAFVGVPRCLTPC